MKGRRVTDQIFALREIQAEEEEDKKPNRVMFIDFKQAYNKVNRRGLLKPLEE